MTTAQVRTRAPWQVAAVAWAFVGATAGAAGAREWLLTAAAATGLAIVLGAAVAERATARRCATS